jgi:hypothetical protein
MSNRGTSTTEDLAVNINAASTRESRVPHRILLGGILAVILAASTVGLAGEASAKPPRGSSQDRACVQAIEDYNDYGAAARKFWADWQRSGNQQDYDLWQIAKRHANAASKAMNRCNS